MAHGANGAAGDERAGVLNGRGVPVAQVDHVDDVGGLGGGGHLMGILGVGSQGLFAQDMFARRNGGQRRGLVHAIRSDIAHRVDIVAGQHVVQRLVNIGNAMALGEGLGLGEITVAYGNHFDTFESAIVLGVLARHAARANNRDTDHLNPSSPGLCRLSPLISTGLGAWSAGTLGQLSIHREPSGCAQTTAFLSTRLTCSS